MRVATIIPVINEAQNLQQLLPKLKGEIIVVDGGSTDGSQEIAQRHGAKVIHSKPPRSRQLNAGADTTNAEILFFLHADCQPPKKYMEIILEKIRLFDAASFMPRFDMQHWALEISQQLSAHHATRYRFGDQGLAIRSKTFHVLGGYDETKKLMETQWLIKKLRKNDYSFSMINREITISARAYKKGPVRKQLTYLLVWALLRLHIPEKHVIKIYHKLS